jgi:hypothetical protein
MIVILLEQVLDDDCSEMRPSKATRSVPIIAQEAPLIGFDRSIEQISEWRTP